MEQKKIFQDFEGDQWYLRNKEKLEKKSLQSDSIIPLVQQILPYVESNAKVLEIGCSSGYRLEWIKNKFGLDVYGIEPSRLAVEEGQKKGLKILQGTADTLPYENVFFDILIFGFCLYLCDKDDLFKIAYEADRVLKQKSFLIIYDFYSKSSRQNPYKHKEGVFTHKMDYTSLFTWHPYYTLFYHEVRDFHQEDSPFTDEEDNFFGLSLLRKNS